MGELELLEGVGLRGGGSDGPRLGGRHDLVFGSPGVTSNDSTIVEISVEVGDASIEVTKTAQITDNGDNEVEAGDIITYDISVENTGDVILKNLTIEDVLTDGNGSNLTLSNGPFFAGSNMNSNSGSILPGEIANYIAFYIIEQQAADTGKILNSVIATASSSSATVGPPSPSQAPPE